MAWLNHELGTRLTDTVLPRGISSARIAHGRLWLTEDPLYEVSVTLSGPNPTDPWRLLSVDVAIGGAPRSGAASAVGSDDDERLVAADQIPMVHRMVQVLLDAGGPEPLHAACTALRGFCYAVRLMELTDEAHMLTQRWGPRVRIAVSPNQHLHITYWSTTPAADKEAPPPTLKLALVEGAVLDTASGKGLSAEVTLRATHEPELVDPDTGKEILFSAVCSHTCFRLPTCHICM